MANLTDADKVLRNDTGKDIVTKLNAIKIAIENSGGGGSSTFEGLTDVDIDDQTLTNGQVPKYNSTTQKWENGDVSLVGDLDDLSDVDTTGKANGDSLRYDANASEWIAKPTTVALTQAEYDALQTKEPNTHYVITDAPNLNPTASDIEYSSGVTVKQAIDSKADTSAIPTIDVAQSSSPVTDNSTYQIPTAILNHSIIIIEVYRYGYCGSMVFSKNGIGGGACSGGVRIYAYTSAKEFKISPSGLITALTGFGTDGLYVKVIGMF